MRIHWINDNHKPGDRKGSIIRQGRAYFHTGADYRTPLRVEWCFLTTHCRASFMLGSRGDEDLLQFNLAFWLFAIWVTINPPRLHERLIRFFKVENYEDRELSISLHDNSVFWNLWTPSMEWSREKHGRRQGAFHPVDFIFGRTKYSEIPILEVEAEVPMPEAVYPSMVKLVEAQWRRPRWPFVWRRILRAEITPKTPIPSPGKGENSWDCGEDATHSLTCTASTVEEAVGKMVQSVMRSRLRYGGKKWRPEKQSA